jgi:adenylate cyclase
MRIGIHTGPVVAGVIGTSKFAYDLWGDTVNVASRMESHGLPGHIQVSATTYRRLRGQYHFTARGPVSMKGKGKLKTYLLDYKKASGRPTHIRGERNAVASAHASHTLPNRNSDATNSATV